MYKRAGLAQINGPDSAQKRRLGWPRPNKNLGRSRPNLKFFFSLGRARPRHAKLGQHRAGPAKKPQRGENYFSPPPASCMQNDSACRRQTPATKMQRWRRLYLAWRRLCVAGLSASLAVLQWRPVAVSRLTGGGSKQRRCCLKRRREGFFLFLSPLFPSLLFCCCFFFSFSFLSSVLPFCFLFLLPVSLFFFFQSFFVFFSFSPFLFSFFFGSPLASFSLLRSLSFVLSLSCLSFPSFLPSSSLPTIHWPKGLWLLWWGDSAGGCSGGVGGRRCRFPVAEEERRRRKICRNWVKLLVFGWLWTRIVPPSDHKIRLYL